MLATLGTVALKAAILLAASAIGALVLRRSTAAARHQIWTLGVIGALVLPIAYWAIPSLSPSSSIATTFAFEAIFVTPGASHATPPAWPAWIAIAWALGTVAVTTQIIRRHLAARRLIRAAAPIDAQLLRSDTIGSPMTIGILRPRVLLPAAADAWSPARLRAVLVHERGHIQRRDTAVQLAAQLACALYWWNPLAWLAAARLRIEREHACDDLVLGAGILPSSYAADLLDVARSISTAHTHAAICMADHTSTATRLRRILDATAPRRPLRTRFRIATYTLAIASIAILACSSSPPAFAPTSPPALGTLSVGMPFVRGPDMMTPTNRGSIDLGLVSTEVQRRIGTLEDCYERRLAAEPALSGTVVIHWSIAETGKVDESCITDDTVGDPELVACVNALVDAGPFPAPHGGAVSVSYPFVFATRVAVVDRR